MPVDPLEQLRTWIDGALDELPETRLALALEAEMADPIVDGPRRLTPFGRVRAAGEGHLCLMSVAIL